MTSSKNTELEKVSPRSLSLTEEPDKRDQQIAVLQRNLDKEKDSRREERYWLAFTIVVLIDCILIQNIGWKILPILLIELVPAIYFAKKLGIDEAAEYLDKLAGLFVDLFKGKSN